MENKLWLQDLLKVTVPGILYLPLLEQNIDLFAISERGWITKQQKAGARVGMLPQGTLVEGKCGLLQQGGVENTVLIYG